MIYAYAALLSGIPFANGAPNLTVDIPALTEMAQGAQGARSRARTSRPGQTMMKTIIAPGLRARMLGLHGWFSTNILGNRDGEVLDDPGSFRTKEVSKTSVLDAILQPELYPELYGDYFHKVRIEYYPPRGDAKEGWDNIDIFGWLGQPMQIKIDFLCRDSILAAPIVLDLILFLDLAQRAGLSGIQEWLSFYFKSPMSRPDLKPRARPLHPAPEADQHAADPRRRGGPRPLGPRLLRRRRRRLGEPADAPPDVRSPRVSLLALRLIAVYGGSAAAVLWLAHRFVRPLSRRASRFSSPWRPCLLTGKALLDRRRSTPRSTSSTTASPSRRTARRRASERRRRRCCRTSPTRGSRGARPCATRSRTGTGRCGIASCWLARRFWRRSCRASSIPGTWIGFLLPLPQAWTFDMAFRFLVSLALRVPLLSRALVPHARVADRRLRLGLLGLPRLSGGTPAVSGDRALSAAPARPAAPRPGRRPRARPL